MSDKDYTIHDVLVKHVPVATLTGQIHRVTRVTMYVGPHGPFTQDFGVGTTRSDNPDAINAWKSTVVQSLMAVDAQV